MVVKGIWKFLYDHGLEGEPVNFRELTTRFKNQPVIAVDFRSLFHDIVKKHFFLIEPRNYDKASKKVLLEAEKFLSKEKCEIFFTGFHTVERNARSTMINERRKEAYYQLISKLQSAKNSYDFGSSEVKEIRNLVSQVFHISINMRNSLAKVAADLGWNVVLSRGDSDIDMASHGGDVITNDSDLFFYRNVSGIIFPSRERQNLGKFMYYNKKKVQDKLSLSEEQWIALGIISSNNFNGFPELSMLEAYKLLKKQEYKSSTIEKCIAQVSLKYHFVLNENETRISNYKTAYQIFVKMEQHVMECNTITEYYEGMMAQKPLLNLLREVLWLKKR